MSSIFPHGQYLTEKFLKSLYALVYPQRCLHCDSAEVQSPQPLCPSCSARLILLPKLGRCMRCFAGIDGGLCCRSCSQNPPLIISAAAAFEYEGPAATLAKGLKYASLDYLAVGMGAFMAMQYFLQQWPWPDCIVPVPLSATRLLKRGYNQSALLADSVATYLQRPVVDILGRYSGDYSQAGLFRQQRLELSANNFVLRSTAQCRDKTILLIDDVMTTGTTLSRCAEVLQQGRPAAIYAIAFCKAMD